MTYVTILEGNSHILKYSAKEFLDEDVGTTGDTCKVVHVAKAISVQDLILGLKLLCTTHGWCLCPTHVQVLLSCRFLPLHTVIVVFLSTQPDNIILIHQLTSQN